MNTRSLPVLQAFLIVMALLSHAHGGAMPDAARIVRASGAPGGICTVVGSATADLPLALAKQGRFVVHSLCTDAATLASVRAAVRARGMYGTVSAELLRDGRLPYMDNLVNIAVVDATAGVSPKDVVRALAPLGMAWFGASGSAPLVAELRKLGLADVAADGAWVRARKPWPADIDEWTHYLHGADGNPVARDRVVGPPKRTQWVSEPRWLRSHETDSSVSTLVTARGRLFAIIDEAPISLVGKHPLPDKWSLVAQDAFNGVVLWKVPIRRWGWREWKPTWFTYRPGDFPLNIRKRLVAMGDKVYVTLGYRAPVCELDARTGAILKTYAATEGTGEVLYVDGTLILAIVGDDGVRVAAVNAATGETLWTTPKVYRGSTVDYLRWGNKYGQTKKAKLDPSLNLAADARLVAITDGPAVVGIDARTGTEKWRTPFPSPQADRSAGGMQSKGTLWVGTLIVADGTVLHASPSLLAAFDAASGKMLWSQPKRYIGHLWYEWKDVFVIDGLVWTWSAELERSVIASTGKRKQYSLSPKSANGYDLKTGKLVKSVPLGPIFKTHHHHRCYRNKATVRYILASRRGTEFVDLLEGKHTVHNWVRGTCHVGMMPANGLQYAPPHPCACYIDEKLKGMNALAPAAPGEAEAGASTPGLERGSAYGKATGPAAGAEDWPAFRRDGQRTGAVPTRVPDKLALLWRRAVGSKVSAPIAVGGRLYASLADEHHVVCLDARNGRTVWEFAAGARIDSPPTYHKGTVVFGSRDGSVYCVRAADGQLAWRVHAAPAQRLIGAFGQLESAWPVHGSVLVQKGTAYFAAGRSSQLDGGIHLFGVDATTGRLLHRTRLEGPDYKAEDIKVNYQLPMGSLPDILMGDGERVFMR
ncbi:PQQ-binding-like beta-propeller repeat protein, partial [bacterium]|nr:PQQ-binding-like beta-propeller repeat protein [bacterium]